RYEDTKGHERAGLGLCGGYRQNSRRGLFESPFHLDVWAPEVERIQQAPSEALRYITGRAGWRAGRGLHNLWRGRIARRRRIHAQQPALSFWQVAGASWISDRQGIPDSEIADIALGIFVGPLQASFNCDGRRGSEQGGRPTNAG